MVPRAAVRPHAGPPRGVSGACRPPRRPRPQPPTRRVRQAPPIQHRPQLPRPRCRLDRATSPAPTERRPGGGSMPADVVVRHLRRGIRPHPRSAVRGDEQLVLPLRRHVTTRRPIRAGPAPTPVSPHTTVIRTAGYRPASHSSDTRSVPAYVGCSNAHRRANDDCPDRHVSVRPVPPATTSARSGMSRAGSCAWTCARFISTAWAWACAGPVRAINTGPATRPTPRHRPHHLIRPHPRPIRPPPSQLVPPRSSPLLAPRVLRPSHVPQFLPRPRLPSPPPPPQRQPRRERP